MLHSAVFRRWLSAVAPARRHAAGTPRRPARCRTARRGLVLEQLEDRTVLSPVSLVVTSLADSGLGTLREAITTANGDTSNAYIIDFAVTGAINLTTSAPDLSNNTTSALDLSNNITIQGPGAGNLTVQRATDLPFGIFVIDTGWTVSISGLTIANGATPTNGGGIFNFGTLKVTNCTLDNNSALGDEIGRAHV